MSTLSDQAKNNYKLRIKPRLDGRFVMILSGDKPAFVLTMDKKGQYHIVAKTKEWSYRMSVEGGIQDYLSELLNCLYAYKFEVEKLEYQQYLLGVAFNYKKSPTN